MEKDIATLNNYIAKSKCLVNDEYRLAYHMMPPIGWLNDPNGLIKFKGRYHLYYQFNPYASAPGRMCWGHFVSDDLISYVDDGVALKPDAEDASAYSGGAIEVDDRIYAYYTLHTENSDGKREEVYRAASTEGFCFGHGKKVFDNETLPEGISRTDFRDPCPVKVGDTYYLFVGGNVQNKGVIVALKSKTPDKFEYAFTLGPYYELGTMCECPSYMRIGDKDVFVVCGCNVPSKGNSFKNINSSVFIVGDLNLEKGRMDVDYIREVDKGDSFYAPQFIRGASLPIMIGWLEMWEKKYPTKEKNHGWVGSFTIPRELALKDGELYQIPVSSLQNYLCDVRGDKVPKCADIRAHFDGKGYIRLKGGNGTVTVGNDSHVYLDTLNANNMVGCIRHTDTEYKSCDVRILLDVSSIEVFVADGREVISSRIYIDGNYDLETNGDVSAINIKEIGKRQ